MELSSETGSNSTGASWLPLDISRKDRRVIEENVWDCILEAEMLNDERGILMVV